MVLESIDSAALAMMSAARRAENARAEQIQRYSKRYQTRIPIAIGASQINRYKQ